MTFSPRRRAFGHFDDHFADAAGRDHDQRVARAECEVAQDLLGVAKRLLQVQALSQAVGTDDEVVVRQAQCDNSVPADEAALARRHLLAHHPAVPAAEEVYQSIGSDGVGAQRGCPVERVALTVQKRPKARHGFTVKSLGGRERGCRHGVDPPIRFNLWKPRAASRQEHRHAR